MKTLFTNRAFMMLMLSDLLQNAGIWIRNMALLFFVMEKSGGNPGAVSLLTVIEYAPIFLFSIIGGVLADRWRPRRTMLWGDILSFLSVLLILVVVKSGYWEAVFVVTLVSAVLSQFSQPSSMKIIKRCLPEELMTSAAALSQTMMSLFIIAGPIAGTFVYQELGLEASLIMLLFVFAGSALSIAMIPSSVDQTPSDEGAEPNSSSFGKELMDGVRYVKASRMLTVMLAVYVVLALGSGLVQPLDIFIITERLQLEMTRVQWFTALEGAGLLVGSIAAALIAEKLKGRLVLFIGLAFLGVSTCVEVLSVWPALTGTMRFLTGLLLALAQTALTAYMLKMVDEKFAGRLSGLMTPLFTAAVLAGAGSTGVFMNAASITAVYFTAGGLFLLSSVISLRLPAQEAAVERT